AMALVEVGARPLVAVAIVRAEDPEAVERVADQRVALVDPRHTVAKRVAMITPARLRAAAARVLDVIGELVVAGRVERTLQLDPVDRDPDLLIGAQHRRRERWLGRNRECDVLPGNRVRVGIVAVCWIARPDGIDTRRFSDREPVAADRAAIAVDRG